MACSVFSVIREAEHSLLWQSETLEDFLLGDDWVSNLCQGSVCSFDGPYQNVWPLFKYVIDGHEHGGSGECGFGHAEFGCVFAPHLPMSHVGADSQGGNEVELFVLLDGMASHVLVPLVSWLC